MYLTSAYGIQYADKTSLTQGVLFVSLMKADDAILTV